MVYATTPNSAVPAGSTGPVATTTQAVQAQSALSYIGNGQWKSVEGLIYGQGSQQGNRVLHVLEHLKPDPSKPLHTVFNVQANQLLGLIDEAWTKRGQPVPNDPGAFLIDMGRVIGTAGEQVIKIIVRPGTSEIITAYPVN